MNTAGDIKDSRKVEMNPQDPWIPSAFEAGLVSVVIPTRNRGPVIGETLDSVTAQRYRPLEVIVVDDGSEDDTAAVVQRWAGSQARQFRVRAKYLRQQRSGAPTARNRGCHASRGQYIQFLDSDDTLAETKLEEQVRALSAAADARQAAYGPWRCFYQPRLGSRWWHGPPHQLASMPSEDVMLRGYLSGCWYAPLHSYLFTRAAVVASGAWNVNLSIRQDSDFLVRVLLGGTRFVYVERAWSFYRRSARDHIGHPRHFGRMIDSQISALRSWTQLIGEANGSEYVAELAQALSGLADQAVRRGEWAAAERCRTAARMLPGGMSAVPNRKWVSLSRGLQKVKGAAAYVLGDITLEWLRYGAGRLRRGDQRWR